MIGTGFENVEDSLFLVQEQSQGLDSGPCRETRRTFRIESIVM